MPTVADTVHTQAYIDGQFVDVVSGDTLQTLNPATGQILATVAACHHDDVPRAVASARTAFDSGIWSDVSPAERKSVLLRFASLIKVSPDELAMTESLDAGKPTSDCRTFDIPDVLTTLRWYAGATDKAFGKTFPTGPDHLGLIVREPVGVVGGVLPWNFPMSTLAWTQRSRTAIGPLIEPTAVRRVLGYVDQAASDGARVVVGGEQLHKRTGGNYVAPTILDHVSATMSVAREETFGPVACVIDFDDLDETVHIANDAPYGLAATVWSKNIDTARRAARSVRAGTVAINGYSEGDVSTPFGGYRCLASVVETTGSRLSSSTPN